MYTNLSIAQTSLALNSIGMYDGGDCCDPRSGADQQGRGLSSTLIYNNQCHISGQRYPVNMTRYMTQYLNGTDNGVKNSQDLTRNNPYLKNGRKGIHVGPNLLSLFAHAQYAKMNTEKARDTLFANGEIIGTRNKINKAWSGIPFRTVRSWDLFDNVD